MRRVLVVDDDESIRSLVSLSLRGAFEVEDIEDPTEAIALLRQRVGEFDALVLDLAMPRMSGFEVLEALRADPVTEALPVLVLTARSDRDSRMDAFVGGGHRFVVKPFDPDQLVQQLSELIEESSQGREAARLRELLEREP